MGYFPGSVEKSGWNWSPNRAWNGMKGQITTRTASLLKNLLLSDEGSTLPLPQDLRLSVYDKRVASMLARYDVHPIHVSSVVWSLYTVEDLYTGRVFSYNSEAMTAAQNLVLEQLNLSFHNNSLVYVWFEVQASLHEDTVHIPLDRIEIVNANRRNNLGEWVINMLDVDSRLNEAYGQIAGLGCWDMYQFDSSVQYIVWASQDVLERSYYQQSEIAFEDVYEGCRLVGQIVEAQSSGSKDVIIKVKLWKHLYGTYKVLWGMRIMNTLRKLPGTYMSFVTTAIWGTMEGKKHHYIMPAFQDWGENTGVGIVEHASVLDIQTKEFDEVSEAVCREILQGIAEGKDAIMHEYLSEVYTMNISLYLKKITDGSPLAIISAASDWNITKHQLVEVLKRLGRTDFVNARRTFTILLKTYASSAHREIIPSLSRAFLENIASSLMGE